MAPVPSPTPGSTVATKRSPASKTSPAPKDSSASENTGKAAARKPAAKAKKSTAKSTAGTRRSAAKSPAGAKKAPAKGKATPKKASARPKATKKTPAKTKAKKEPKSPFQVGDKVVYPHHGAATIVKKEKREFGGERRDYFVLEIATDQLIVRVPVDKAVELGVRPVISKAQARKVFGIFKEQPQEAGSNWSRWYKLLTEKINSGDIFQVAEVVRDLTYAQQVKGISPALKRMLAKARLIILSELRFSLGLSEEEATKKLERALPKVEQPADV